MTDNLEQAIIGLALTADPQVMLDLDRVRPQHFADLRHGALWALIRKVAQQHAPDPLTIAGALPSLPAEDRNGINDGYLLDCLHEAPAAPRVLAASYAQQLIDAAGHRNLEAALIRAGQVLEGTPDPVEADGLIRSVLDEAAPDSQHVGHLIADTLDATLATIGRPGAFTPTPWVDLNNTIGGWRPGALYVVGARPSAGKTLMGLQAAYGLAHHGPVAVSSLEMPQREVHTRLLAHAGQVDIGHLTGQGQPTDAEWSAINEAGKHLAALPISVDDRSSATVWDVTTHARILARHQHLAGVVVDYMQLMTTPRGDRRPRHEVVAEQSRQLKILAGELDCPVIALSQLNRQSEQRPGGGPSLADLRESGAIEQDADVVLLLNVPVEGGMPDQSRLDVAVAKNRHGSSALVHLQRDGKHATLNDLAWTPHGSL